MLYLFIKICYFSKAHLLSYNMSYRACRVINVHPENNCNKSFSDSKQNPNPHPDHILKMIIVIEEHIYIQAFEIHQRPK